MLRFRTALWAICLSGAWSPAWSADAVTGASPSEVTAGESLRVWITGRGFVDGATVVVSGSGVSTTDSPRVILEGDRTDGGQGDGIIVTLEADAGAPGGSRDITVSSDRGSATGNGLLTVAGGQAPPEADEMEMSPNNPAPMEGGAMMQAAGSPEDVDVITRASPAYAEQGTQINLWVAGRSFVPGSTLSFVQNGMTLSEAAMGPAAVEGRPLPLEIFKNVASEADMTDGMQYFLQIANGPDAPLGLIDLKVTNPNGTSAVGMGMIEILRPNTLEERTTRNREIDSITGASPPGAFTGRNVALWIWGKGFEDGVRVEFSSPYIQQYSPPQVVLDSRSHPGFDGIRNFIVVSPDAEPGPVDVTIINPNGSRASAFGLFELQQGSAQPIGPDGAVQSVDGCPDFETVVESIESVSPLAAFRGGRVELAVSGRGFACGASVIITGGGLTARGEPNLRPDPDNPDNVLLTWEIEIADNAKLGDRDLTILNPNNSRKTLENAFAVSRKPPSNDVSCQTLPGRNGGSPRPAFLILWAACALLIRPRMKRQPMSIQTSRRIKI